MDSLIWLLAVAAMVAFAVGGIWLIARVTRSSQRPTKSDLKFHEARGRGRPR